MSKIDRIKKVALWVSCALVITGVLIEVVVHINWTWIQREAWAELIMNTVPQFVKDCLEGFILAPLYEKGVILFALGIMLLLVSQLERP